MWSPPPPASAVRAGSRYAHFGFPALVAVDAAMAAAEQAVAALPGWEPVAATSPGGASEVAGHRAWVHLVTGAELLAVIAGFQPLVLSAGQRSPDARAGSAKARRDRLATVTHALWNLEQSVHALGGWTVRDAELFGLVRQAHERFAWWVRAEQRTEALAPYLTHRSCPACRGWSAFEARRCHHCRHEFTAHDDLGRDDARAAAEQEIAGLRAAELHPAHGGLPHAPADAPTEPGPAGGTAWR